MAVKAGHAVLCLLSYNFDCNAIECPCPPNPYEDLNPG